MVLYVRILTGDRVRIKATGKTGRVVEMKWYWEAMDWGTAYHYLYLVRPRGWPFIRAKWYHENELEAV